ncbi:long-chain-fatty-acid--CoA ligase [Nocardia sp. CA2R105]|uniref:fatty acyl-CoA synthetase n=1 Tax=Nocardia coffeae TaxID=2873381 RepID=UPI001CA667CB|nr:fatty acyl-CoA synthetase [Nocardia coffeae]MBY8857260.1 long-chain-fatty-acid--CoA ligase [Nocardia coffeae]
MTTTRSADIDLARTQSFGEIPRRSAARDPEKIAIVHRDVRLTFREFDEMIDRTASALYARGLRKGDTLAILSHNCWQYPVLAFATARIGVVFVPVNFMLTAHEVAYILDDCRAAAFVVEDELVDTADKALALADTSVRVRASIPLSQRECDGWPSTAEWTAADHPAPPTIVLADDDLIRIMYTSGTESRPKGAMHSSRTLMWQYMSCIVTGGMSADDIEIHSLPLYHCAQLDNFLSTDILLGATSVILDRPDPGAIVRAVRTVRATKLFCPPTVWISLLGHPDFSAETMSSLRKGYYGASALPTEVLSRIAKHMPDLRLWNFYGQTEMASLATALAPEDQTSRPGSAGRAALNVQTRIVDETGAPVPVGEVGEIVHRSPQATIGYLNQPDKTAEAFRGGWFHSGDLGYLDSDGYLWVVDRSKDMIKTGGENVAGREVEEVLFEIDGVAEAAVVGVPHPRWIEAVVAVVVPVPGASVDAEAVLSHCRNRLAGYKVPKYVLMIEELPKNPSGKILKRDLRERYRDIATAD